MNEHKVEFIARTVTDIGKAVVIASIIGNLFKELPFWLACVIIGIGVLFIVVGITIYPGDKK